MNKKEINEFAKEKGISFREDKTNACTDYTRNHIRLNIVPLLKEINPSIEETAARNAAILAAEQDFISGFALEFLNKNSKLDNDISIDAEEFNEQHIALKRIILRQAIKNVFSIIDISAANIEDIIKLCEKNISSKRVEIKNALEAYMDYGRLVIKKRKTLTKSLHADIAFDVADDKIIELGDISLKISAVRDANIKCKDKNEEFADLSAFSSLEFRHRKAGDKIKPLNFFGEKLLADYLSDKKISKEKRDELFVVANGSDVLIVFGVGISDKVKITDKTEKIYNIKLF